MEISGLEIDAGVMTRLWSGALADGSGCWIWQRGRTAGGYSQLRIGGAAGKTIYGHRVAYTIVNGPIPDGLQIDHLCRVRHCINPSHLEAVTSRTNTLRGTSTASAKAKQTHCNNGHEFTTDNTWMHHGWRRCRECTLEANRRRYRKRRSATPASSA